MTGQSLYRDHDIELIFDTLITQDDLDLVRRYRDQSGWAWEACM